LTLPLWKNFSFSGREFSTSTKLRVPIFRQEQSTQNLDGTFRRVEAMPTKPLVVEALEIYNLQSEI
jgi:hypothetical protein